MTSYTAAELIAAAKAYIAAEAAIMSKRPAGMPRAAWRDANASALPPTTFAARDHTMASKPARQLDFTANSGNPYDLWVWADTKLIERIDLRSDDADEKLARYERL